MALIKVFFVVTLVVLARAQEECVSYDCTTDDVALLEAENTQAANHYYIGAMFNVHVKGSDAYTPGHTKLRGLVNSEAFFWAIKTYSDRAGLTTNTDPVSVGGFVMDTSERVEKAIEAVYSFETCRTRYTNVSPRNTVAFVGASNSAQSIATANLLNDMKVTQVSSMSTSPELSDDMYEYFLRTVPSDYLETEVMAKLMQYKSIKYVQVLYQESTYGMGLFHAFKEAIQDKDVCITNYMSFEMASGGDVATFLRSNMQTRFVVVLSNNIAARVVLEAADSDSDLQNQ